MLLYLCFRRSDIKFKFCHFAKAISTSLKSCRNEKKIVVRFCHHKSCFLLCVLNFVTSNVSLCVFRH